MIIIDPPRNIRPNTADRISPNISGSTVVAPVDVDRCLPGVHVTLGQAVAGLEEVKHTHCWPLVWLERSTDEYHGVG